MALEAPSPAALDAATLGDIAEYVGPGLDRLPKGRQHPKVFVPLRRLVVTSTVEVVAFQAGTEGEKVLIGRRGYDPGDPYWQGMLNLPGSLRIPTEELEGTELVMSDGRSVDIEPSVITFDLIAPKTDLVLATEFEGSVKRVGDVHELFSALVDSESGRENKTWTWTEADLVEGHNSPIDGTFYDTAAIITDPPKNLLRGHHYFVEKALEALQAEAA